MSKIEVNGARYECGKLDAVTQLHVVRRLGPMLVVAGISVEMLQAGMKIELDDLVAMAGPVMEIMAKMSDEDVNYIIFSCLHAVKREQGGAWAPIVIKETRQWMFADIEMPSMIRLVVEVLKENLGGFLKEPGGAPT